MAVSDTGPGIPPEHRARVFDEFFQLRNPERDRSKGRGLGLAICKRLAEAMGGDILIETGETGSTFVLTLPASCVVARGEPAPAPGGPAAAVPPASPALAGLRVLVVEDHADTRRVVAAFLAAEGATVSEASDGRSALAMVREGTADVVLLDLMLPDVSGLEVLRAIRAARPTAVRAILVLTGDSASGGAEESLRLGADGLILNPVEPTALLARLRTVARDPGPGNS